MTETRYAAVLRNREFRALVIAQATSEVGDHFARVALAGVVLQRTDSAFFAATAFVVGYVPGIFGAAVLSPYADRWPRKHLMLGCDLARAVVIAALALLVSPLTDEAPLPLLVAVLLVAEMFSAPFDAARGALQPDILTDPADYLAGNGLSRVLHQANQVIGLTAAGLLVFLVNPWVALLVDASTFLVSYVIVLVGVRSRPAPSGGGGDTRRRLWSELHAGVTELFGDRVRRRFVLLGWGAALVLIAPEGVALAYARQHGHADLGGALMAAIPAGGAVGAYLIARMDPRRAVAVIRPLLLFGCVPLLLTGLNLGVVATAALWLIAGACQAFLVPLIVTVTLLTPPDHRGRVNGLAAAGFNVGTALSFLLAGLVADLTTPALAVVAAGLAGLVLFAIVQAGWPARELRYRLRQIQPAT